MSGLINGAKQKIWLICNQIANGRPTPDLKIGLIAFRDLKDEYITKVFDLSEDLDEVYGNLQEFKANGGGDGPESVNQALHEAITKIKWSKSRKVMKLVFLVGDAPPHMDYATDVKYPETCKLAVQKNIIINAIQCGTDSNCKRIWQEISTKAGGSFANISQGGGVVTISTPYDKRLAEINAELVRSTLVFGDTKKKDADRKKAEVAEKLPTASAADRAGYAAKSRRTASYDLLDAIKRGKVRLEGLKKEELPKAMQGLTLKQRKEFLEKTQKRRTELNREALQLDKKRSAYIRKKLAERGKDSFDNQVLEALRKQAKRYRIAY